MPPRHLWVCLQEQWPVDCAQFCMPLLPLSLNTSFFCCRLHAVKKSQQKHLCLRLFFEGLLWGLAFLTSHKSSKNSLWISLIKFWWMWFPNCFRIPKQPKTISTNTCKLQDHLNIRLSFIARMQNDTKWYKYKDANLVGFVDRGGHSYALGFSILLQKDQGVSRCLQQRRQSGHFRQWSRRLLSQCSQVLTSFWNDITWPNYPLRLPLATLQLVRLKTSPASNVTSNRCLTSTNTQHSCKSCTCNLVICTSQVASMTSPASWHALQSFSVVLGSPVRIAAKQLCLYLHRCRQYKRTKSVSRNSKSWAYQH